MVIKGGDSGPFTKNLVKLLSLFFSRQGGNKRAEAFSSLQNQVAISSGMSFTRIHSQLMLPRAIFPKIMEMRSSNRGERLLPSLISN